MYTVHSTHAKMIPLSQMVIRSGISPKHSEVAGALLERARVVQSARDSSSDSDSPSEPMATSGASQSPSANTAFGFSYVDSSLGSLQASEVGVTQTYVPEPTALTLQQVSAPKSETLLSSSDL